jgi:CBS domain-containing protein
MTRDLKTVAADATIAEAIDALDAAHVSGLPVVDRFGRAVGVISARDILAAERARHDPEDRARLFDQTLVLEIMQAWAATTPPHQSVQVAAERMLDLGVQRLFVEDQGALIGVVSMTDVARAVATAAV